MMPGPHRRLVPQLPVGVVGTLRQVDTPRQGWCFKNFRKMKKATELKLTGQDDCRCSSAAQQLPASASSYPTADELAPVRATSVCFEWTVAIGAASTTRCHRYRWWWHCHRCSVRNDSNQFSIIKFQTRITKSKKAHLLTRQVRILERLIMHQPICLW